jgi:hypothetical protein
MRKERPPVTRKSYATLLAWDGGAPSPEHTPAMPFTKTKTGIKTNAPSSGDVGRPTAAERPVGIPRGNRFDSDLRRHSDVTQVHAHGATTAGRLLR